MKTVTFFYIQGCLYCDQAKQTLAQFQQEDERYAQVEFQMIDEIEHPEIADQYDYNATPCMFIGEQKIYESHIGETAEEARQHVKEVLDLTIQ